MTIKIPHPTLQYRDVSQNNTMFINFLCCGDKRETLCIQFLSHESTIIWEHFSTEFYILHEYMSLMLSLSSCDQIGIILLNRYSEFTVHKYVIVPDTMIVKAV